MSNQMPHLTSSRMLLCSLPIAALAAGCGGEYAEESSGEWTAEAQFSATWSYLWRHTIDTFLDIGSSVNRTCFLSGMVGSLVSSSGTTGVGVRMVGSKYELYVDSGGDRLGGYARCVNTAAGRTAEVTWTTGQAAKLLAPVAANRRCYLTQVRTSSSGGSRGFKSNSDYVRVWEDGSNWYVGGVQSGGASATARCINITENHGAWLWIAGDPGTRKDKLAYNPGGVTCFLQGIGGHFDNSDYSDGAYISYEEGIKQYYLNTKNGKRGWAHCAK